jgi:hypothetical protein
MGLNEYKLDKTRLDSASTSFFVVGLPPGPFICTHPPAQFTSIGNDIPVNSKSPWETISKATFYLQEAISWPGAWIMSREASKSKHTFPVSKTSLRNASEFILLLYNRALTTATFFYPEKPSKFKCDPSSSQASNSLTPTGTCASTSISTFIPSPASRPTCTQVQSGLCSGIHLSKFLAIESCASASKARW